jgi:hypothetical protein
MNMSKTILVAGDSWTFGSEIKDPTLSEDIKDWDVKNNSYRIPRIWPTLLATELGTSLTNLSYPAASNDRILRLTESWLYENYISINKDTRDLTVIIGWTSPERKDFVYDDPSKKHSNPNWTTIWPQQGGFNYIQPGMNSFFKTYVTYLWHEREALNRYVHQVTAIQNLCKVHNIKLLMFQAFYDKGLGIHGADENIDNFIDHKNPGYINDEFEKAEIGENYPGWHHHYSNELNKTMWECLDQKIFLQQSFFGYMKKHDMDKTITGQHPNELGHKLWADHIKDYITGELQ